MKKIMIFDVPAEHGGALTVLNEFYNSAIMDLDNEYIFVLSTPYLNQHKNLKVLNFPWVKRSWFHRLWFDLYTAKRIVQNNKPTEIISLQNTYIKNTLNVPQTILVHQPLPFTKFKMNIFTDFKLWIYQNVIGSIIKKSIQKASNIIVQTHWMKKACGKYINSEKIEIMQNNYHSVIPKDIIPCKNEKDRTTFFYPASAIKYKNHNIIIKALRKLKNVQNIEIVFTLDKNQNRLSRRIFKKSRQLPIKFVGNLEYREVFEYYSSSILLFPSYIETLGLPLLEAQKMGTKIIASDTEFAHEICKDYDNVQYFDPFNEVQLSELIKQVIDEKKLTWGLTYEIKGIK